MQEIIEKVNRDLRKSLVSVKVLVSKFYVLDEIKSQLFFTDPTYLPFYYHLGKYISPNTILEFGVGGGLTSGLFFMNSKRCEHYLGFQPQLDYYSFRTAKRNIRNYYKGKIDLHHGLIHDVEFVKKMTATKWDLVMITVDLESKFVSQMLNLCWDNVNKDGYILLDHCKKKYECGKSYRDFCLIKNRSESYFNTKYGVGIVRR